MVLRIGLHNYVFRLFNLYYGFLYTFCNYIGKNIYG